jgi:putative oxidoreductase
MVVSLILRLIVGIIFLTHGFPKLQNLDKTKDFIMNLRWFKPVTIWAILLGTTEFFGGLFLLVGFMTKIAAGLLLIVMCIALIYHVFVWQDSFKNYELSLLLTVCLIALLMLNEEFSVDGLIGWNLG